MLCKDDSQLGDVEVEGSFLIIVTPSLCCARVFCLFLERSARIGLLLLTYLLTYLLSYLLARFDEADALHLVWGLEHPSWA